MKFKDDPDFARHNTVANETAARELDFMLEKIAAAEDEDALEDVYEAAKRAGYNVRALKKLVKNRKEDPEREKYPETDLNLYKQLVGMVV